MGVNKTFHFSFEHAFARYVYAIVYRRNNVRTINLLLSG
jgi:hypothetical protein